MKVVFVLRGAAKPSLEIALELIRPVKRGFVTQLRETVRRGDIQRGLPVRMDHYVQAQADVSTKGSSLPASPKLIQISVISAQV
jgi:hypothetical protein